MKSDPEEWAEIFSASAGNPSWPSAPDRVHEPGRPGPSWPYSERHVQCVWFDPRHRPASLATQDGEPLWVDDPGIWNQEAGPDFLGAVVRVGAEQPPVRGDVEVHTHPIGWNQHGHGSDPRYQNVRLHVTWFPGKLPARDLPPDTLQLSLGPTLSDDPCFSLDAVDTTAYPYAARATTPPCAGILQTWHPDRKESLLEAAGKERMHRKAERFRLRMAHANAEQVLYEEVLSALGYKHNKLAFRALARCVPLSELQAAAIRDPWVGYAVLAGCAGLLPTQPKPSWDQETRRFMRQVWDTWWKVRSRFDGRSLSAGDWRLDGIRPTNHPRRRLMAAAHLCASPHPFSHTLRGMAKTLASLRDPYWDTRLSLNGDPQPRPVALIGQSRIHAILVNVFVPYLVATRAADNLPVLLRQIPAEAENQLIRRTAHNLFGPDHPPSLYRNGIQRQGLIQIFQDFCLNDRSRCRTCPLPQALRDANR